MRRWRDFSENEITTLVDGLDAWDFETSAYDHDPQGVAARLQRELIDEARSRGMTELVRHHEAL